ncbi:MAG: DUF4349 domain-containing protein [Candidatus Korarchaeota archaeon]|nr:DUF4349 domain-containing protein [Candidatus Korarchaeota archaeon]
MNKRYLVAVLTFLTLIVAGYIYYPETEREFPRVRTREMLEGKGGYGSVTPQPETVRTTAIAGEYDKSSAGTDFIPGTFEVGREISITVSMVLEVEDVRNAANKVAQLAYSLGGYVKHSSVTKDRGYLTIKVPKSNLNAAIPQLRSLGEVKLEEINTVDLTDAIVDLEARLRNARSEEQRLLDLLNRAENVRDILEIEDRLSAVRERIERLEAMRESMSKRVDYATVNVDLQKRGAGTKEKSFWDKVIEDAGRALMGSIYILVVGTAFLAIPLLVASLAWIGYKRLKSHTNQAETP